MINLLASAAPRTVKAITGVDLQSPASHEREREAWADKTYDSVVNAPNEPAARAALQYLYDQAGLRNPGQFGGGAIGAATQQARDYIKTKYDAALAIIRAKYNNPAITGGTDTNASPADRVQKAAEGTSLTQLVVFGLIGWGVYMLVKKAG